MSRINACFVACRSGQVVVFDTNTGKELQALEIVKGVDDLTFDIASKRLYAAGDGAVSVYQAADADHYTLLGNAPNGTGGPHRAPSPGIESLLRLGANPWLRPRFHSCL